MSPTSGLRFFTFLFYKNQNVFRYIKFYGPSFCRILIFLLRAIEVERVRLLRWSFVASNFLLWWKVNTSFEYILVIFHASYMRYCKQNNAIQRKRKLILDDSANSTGIDELNLIIDHAPCHLTLKTNRVSRLSWLHPLTSVE